MIQPGWIMFGECGAGCDKIWFSSDLGIPHCRADRGHCFGLLLAAGSCLMIRTSILTRFRRISFPISALLSIFWITLFFTHGLNFGTDFQKADADGGAGQIGAADIPRCATR